MIERPLGQPSRRSRCCPSRVYAQLRNAIMRGEYAPSDALEPQDLARQHGVSLAVVREALCVHRGRVRTRESWHWPGGIPAAGVPRPLSQESLMCQISIRRFHHGRSCGANGSLTVRAMTRSSSGPSSLRSSRWARDRREQAARSSSVLTWQ
ncbi:GntR family transcriptional regulator [Nocardia sp. NPDC055029]